jgi:hypothetical protein
MKRQDRSKQLEEETLIEKLKDIGLIGIPLWIILFFFCCVGINECQDRHEKALPTPPPYRSEIITNRCPIEKEQTKTGSKRPIVSPKSKENKLMDEIYKDDYYDYSDYYDGLDGEYSDIDYNDVRDYFED